jgi:hypothetical protein
VNFITKPIEKSLVSNPVAENQRNSKKKESLASYSNELREYGLCLQRPIQLAKLPVGGTKFFLVF